MKNYILISTLFSVFVSFSQQDYKSVLDSLQATDTLINLVEVKDYYEKTKEIIYLVNRLEHPVKGV